MGVVIIQDQLTKFTNMFSDEFADSLLSILNVTHAIYTQQACGEEPTFGFYPQGYTKKSVEDLLKFNDKVSSPYTIIRADNHGVTSVLPYNDAYADSINELCRNLNLAAKRSPDKKLADYLKVRAQDLKLNDYQRGDTLWVGLQNEQIDVDLICGPYETYLDRLFGVKASFEATLSIKNTAAENYFKLIQKNCHRLDTSNFGISNYKSSFDRLEVRDVIGFAGHSANVKMNAKVLPNDPNVIKSVGSRKILFKNVAELRFRKISYKLYQKFVKKNVDLDRLETGLLNFLILHELAHDYHATTPSPVKGPITVALEEAKAHSVSLLFLSQLFEMEILGAEDLEASFHAFFAYLLADIRLSHKNPSKIPYREAAVLILNTLLARNENVWEFRANDLSEIIKMLCQHISKLRYHTTIDNVQRELNPTDQVRLLEQKLLIESKIPYNI